MTGVTAVVLLFGFQSIASHKLLELHTAAINSREAERVSAVIDGAVLLHSTCSLSLNPSKMKPYTSLYASILLSDIGIEAKNTICDAIADLPSKSIDADFMLSVLHMHKVQLTKQLDSKNMSPSALYGDPIGRTTAAIQSIKDHSKR